MEMDGQAAYRGRVRGSGALRKVGNDKSAGDAQVPAEYYKALEKDQITRKYLRKILNDYWCSGSWARVQEVQQQLLEEKEDKLLVGLPRRSMRTTMPSAQASNSKCCC